MVRAHAVGLHYRRGALGSGAWMFYNRLPANLPTLDSEGAAVSAVLDKKEICLFPWREILSLFSKAVWYNHHP